MNPTGGEKIFFAKRMKTHAISLIKIATSQGLLRETAPVIRFFTALIRMRQDKEQVGDFGEVGVNEEMVVKIFTLLMDLRVTATTNLRDLDKKEDQDAEDFVNAMNDFDAKMGENDGDIVDLEKLAEDSKKCRDESAGFMNDLGGPALENGVRSGGRIAK